MLSDPPASRLWAQGIGSGLRIASGNVSACGGMGCGG